MAVTAVTQARIYVGSFEFTSFSNQAEWGGDVAVKEVTTFGTDFQQFVPSLKTFQCNTAGFNDYAGASVDEVVRGLYGSRRVATLTNTTPATGNLAHVGQGIVGGWRAINIAAPGDVPSTGIVIGDGYTATGQLTQISTSTVTATGNSTPVNVGAVATGRTILAAIHVLSVTGTTPSLTAQLASSTTSGGAYTARGTAGAAITAAGDQLITAAGPFTDTWWRLNYTVSGTTPVFTVVASIAITAA